jgi:hypothetical protein
VLLANLYPSVEYYPYFPNSWIDEEYWWGWRLWCNKVFWVRGVFSPNTLGKILSNTHAYTHAKRGLRVSFGLGFCLLALAIVLHHHMLERQRDIFYYWASEPNSCWYFIYIQHTWWRIVCTIPRQSHSKDENNVYLFGTWSIQHVMVKWLQVSDARPRRWRGGFGPAR